MLDSDVIALTVLAGLLSLLPVVVLFWVYYLKEGEPSVPGPVVMRFFATGMLTVLPAILLERGVYQGVRHVSPAAASAFFTDFFAVHRPAELLSAALVAFGVVALLEEGVRYLLLRFLFRRTVEIDQLADGLQVGVAAGLGFAFIENTLYFLRLFQGLEFNTLAVVFFLRFFISTLGHLVFGGIMGYELARALFYPLGRMSHLRRAFWIPWAAHGLFDFLLSIRLSAYTVLFLLLPVAYLWLLYRAPSLHERFRLHGRLLRSPVRGRSWLPVRWRRPPVDVLPVMPWCPTCLTPLTYVPAGNPGSPAVVATSGRCGACGTPLTLRSALAPARAVGSRSFAPLP